MSPLRRGAGVVAPVSIFPGRFGIGDFSGAEEWLTWMERAGLRYWQILPLTIPDSVGSPFASPSSRAVTPVLISPDWLYASGLITASERRAAIRPAGRINHRAVARTKMHLLRCAWHRLQDPSQAAAYRQFTRWQKTAGPWLTEVALYQALKGRFQQQPWSRWPATWRSYSHAKKQITPKVAAAMDFFMFCQWIAETQWQRVRRQAESRGIKIVGHLPFYVQYDSVDVWTRPELFHLDSKRHMTAVSGVTPDAFSATGQLWGTPVYRWSAHRGGRWQWWVERLRSAEELYDVLILDHFPGLVKTWQVAPRAKNALPGRWVPTPGTELLRALKKRSTIPIVAEDLGALTMAAIPLREKFNIAATRILQFAWSGIPHNLHHPEHVPSGAMYFTGNHDTNTTRGWYEDEARWYERKNMAAYLGPIHHVAWQSIAVVMRHQAQVAMVHISDVLNLGTAGRMNHPGTKRRNWAFRLTRWPGTTLARRLRVLALASRRTRRER